MMNHTGSNGNYVLPHKQEELEEYQVKQVQLIVRHGTRYPVHSGMVAINDALEILRTSSNRALVGWIDEYHNDYLFRRTGQLDLHGQHELYLMGRRFANRHQEFVEALVDQDILTTQMQVSASWSSRTLQSAYAFCLGAFEQIGTLGLSKVIPVPIFSQSKQNDSLIAPHKCCPKWQKEAKPSTAYHMAPVVNRYVIPIAQRLGDELALPIAVADVLNFFDACTSDVALKHTVDTFCKLFTKQDILELEYIDDLKHYYKYSYGLPDLNSDMACDLVKSILQNIDEMDNHPDTATKFDLKAGHSETLLPLRYFLGLHKDHEKLSQNTTDKQIEERLYRLSNFGFFANNIAFELLVHKYTKQKAIRVLENEVPIQLPGFNKTVITLKQFRSFIEPKLQCNFTSFCAL
ncbi:Multiple inositol polyphosphate phosphatase 1 [Choanephora cucurbitarum]|uniref:Multiple inositol polyphosphate phosphatase 1 n=1 Tax=Choanephora cucurbitarum TaxID=101091 RepID=A0A1C7N6C7_9FUNG|nr:Multiple inositol polyphosphate phosphatase 1 [Choanephora cucurbitarum]